MLSAAVQARPETILEVCGVLLPNRRSGNVVLLLPVDVQYGNPGGCSERDLSRVLEIQASGALRMNER